MQHHHHPPSIFLSIFPILLKATIIRTVYIAHTHKTRPNIHCNELKIKRCIKINVEHIVKCLGIQKNPTDIHHEIGENIDCFVMAFEKWFQFYFNFCVFAWKFPNRFEHIHMHISCIIIKFAFERSLAYTHRHRVLFSSKCFEYVFVCVYGRGFFCLLDKLLRQKKCLWCKRSHRRAVKYMLKSILFAHWNAVVPH